MKLLFLLMCLANPAFASEYRIVTDPERQRDIPIQVSLPTDVSLCSAENQCPVALLSSGYGVAYDKYSFISDTLNKAGYLVVAIQHELPGDPALAATGHLYTERSENWQRGATTLKFIRRQLKPEFSGYDFNNLTLVGHSNGGDISSLLLNEGVDFTNKLITLDHRRVPLPRAGSPFILSIRGSDYPADEGVLYTEQEKTMLNACIVQIANSKHNDMTDFGPGWLKDVIANTLLSFISGQCNGT
ncbi:alpha/beta hydrolase [Rheinheimera gaetbuli]